MKTIFPQFGLTILIFLSFNISFIRAQIIKEELEEIVIESNSIIKGVVTDIYSEYEGNSRNIITFIKFDVIETIKGSISETQMVVIPGGLIGDRGVMVSHTPKFYSGEEVVVFITNDYKGRPTVTGWIQGSFKIINNKVFYEGSEIIADEFINGIKSFVQNGENTLISFNNIVPDSPQSGPSISNISPNSGPALSTYLIDPTDPFNPGERGTLIDIYGSNFGPTIGTSKVRFYGDGTDPADAYDYTFWSDTHIQCKVPAKACSGSLYVITTGGTSNGIQFTVTFGTYNKRFFNSQITFFINQSGTQDTEGEFSAIQSALQTWNSVNHSELSFTYGGITSRTPQDDDGYNDIGWVESNWPFIQGALAINRAIYGLNGNRIYLIESDIYINGQYSWTTSGQSGRYDVQSTAAHELGHALFLNDLYGNADVEKTMYYAGSQNEIKKRTLEAEDIAGAVYL